MLFRPFRPSTANLVFGAVWPTRNVRRIGCSAFSSLMHRLRQPHTHIRAKGGSSPAQQDKSGKGRPRYKRVRFLCGCPCLAFFCCCCLKRHQKPSRLYHLVIFSGTISFGDCRRFWREMQREGGRRIDSPLLCGWLFLRFKVRGRMLLVVCVPLCSSTGQMWCFPRGGFIIKTKSCWILLGLVRVSGNGFIIPQGPLKFAIAIVGINRGSIGMKQQQQNPLLV